MRAKLDIKDSKVILLVLCVCLFGFGFACWVHQVCSGLTAGPVLRDPDSTQGTICAAGD